MQTQTLTSQPNVFSTGKVRTVVKYVTLTSSSHPIINKYPPALRFTRLRSLPEIRSRDIQGVARYTCQILLARGITQIGVF
jgi:hypothetical protein